MEVKAKLRYLKITPRKMRLLVDVVRGMDVASAMRQLQFMQKRGAEPLAKLLHSAVSNAINNFQLKEENLYIKKITADSGPVLKRWRARAFGRAAGIKKRSSHITIVLDEKVASKRTKIRPAKTGEGKEKLKIVSPEEVKKEATKIPGQDKEKMGEKKDKGFVKKMFTRKTGSA